MKGGKHQGKTKDEWIAEAQRKLSKGGKYKGKTAEEWMKELNKRMSQPRR